MLLSEVLDLTEDIKRQLRYAEDRSCPALCRIGTDKIRVSRRDETGTPVVLSSRYFLTIGDPNGAIWCRNNVIARWRNLICIPDTLAPSYSYLSSD